MKMAVWIAVVAGLLTGRSYWQFPLQVKRIASIKQFHVNETFPLLYLADSDPLICGLVFPEIGPGQRNYITENLLEPRLI